MTLLELSKKTKKGTTSGDTSSLRDPSLLDQADLTKQLGHTENGEISNAVDPVELGSILDAGIKSINPIKQLDFGSGKASPLSGHSLEDVSEESKEVLSYEVGR